MQATLEPIEFYRVRIKFLTTEEGGRDGPIQWTFASYRPDFMMSAGPYHGGVFMDSPTEIALGEEVDVEIAFWCCNSHHEFNPDELFYLHEGPRRVAEGRILSKGVKQYVRPGKTSN